MQPALPEEQHTPLALLFLAFHSSNCALVLASTLTRSFLSPKSNSCRSLRARSVDSGSLYSQNPKASTISEQQGVKNYSVQYELMQFKEEVIQCFKEHHGMNAFG